MPTYKLADYIFWRKDYDFKAIPFNEVDNLILCNLAYIRFKNLIPGDGKEITLTALIELFLKKPTDLSILRTLEDLNFLKTLQNTRRYGTLKLSFHREIYDEEKEIQFAALTVKLAFNHYFISYRGTDNYLPGWKEDLNLSFKTIPSQSLAVTYLNEVIGLHPFARFTLGGHSKGGNLAMYACAHLKPAQYRKIIKIYNNDGPGFLQDSPTFNYARRIIDKLTIFTPQFSLIAQIMTQVKACKIIQAEGQSIFQHDPYNWLTDGDKFVYLDKIDERAMNWQKVCNELLKRLSTQERENFCQGLFQIFNAAEATNIYDIIPGLFKNYDEVLKIIRSKDRKTANALKLLTETALNLLKEDLGSSINNLSDNIQRKLFKTKNGRKENEFN